MMAMPLPIFNKHLFIQGPPSVKSENQSEISSVESDFSDIRSVAAQLGITNPDELHMERFKIDRMKLEDMVKSKFLIFSSLFKKQFIF